MVLATGSLSAAFRCKLAFTSEHYALLTGRVAWYQLFAHARTIPEIFRELVRLWTSCAWLLRGEITKLDMRLAVWQLFTRRWLPLSETQAVTRQGLHS